MLWNTTLIVQIAIAIGSFRLLITGAIFYIAWHVLEMYLRGVASI